MYNHLLQTINQKLSWVVKGKQPIVHVFN